MGNTHQASSGFRRTWIDHTSELNASADTVFALLTDIDKWPSWTPDLAGIKRSDRGQLKVGSRFTMLIKPKGAPAALPVPCQVLKIAPNYIEWGGGFPGSMIRHSFEVIPRDGGRCTLQQVEGATGLLAVLTLPVEKIVYKHDLKWSRAIEKRFA